MRNYIDALKESIEFDRFGTLADEAILGLADLKKGRVNKDKLEAGVLFCTTIIDGYEAWARGKLLFGEADAYKKFRLLDDSREIFEQKGLRLIDIKTEVKIIKAELESILSGQKQRLEPTQIDRFQSYFSTAGIPFCQAANTSLMEAKARKSGHEK